MATAAQKTQYAYRLRGSNASWEWLAMIAPCVHILRDLTKQVHHTFGSRFGPKPTAPRLSRDIDCLMASLKQCNVYAVEEGRSINSDNGEVPNAVTNGIENLQEFAVTISSSACGRCRRASAPSP